MKKLILTFMLLFTITVSQAQEVKTFEEALAPYVEKVMKGVEKGVVFTKEQTPIVLKQYIIYEAVFSWSLVVSGLFLLFGLTRILIKYATVKEIPLKDIEVDEDYKYKRLSNGRYLRVARSDYSLEETIYYVLTPITAIVGMIMFSLSIETAIQSTFFPKLFLVKEFLGSI